MSAAPKSPIRIIGVGNTFRGDDAAGLVVVRGLPKENFPQVDIVESPGTGSALPDAWKNAVRVLIIDAVVTGGPPGTIYRFDVHELGATLPVSHSSTTHGWGLSEALAMGKVFQNLPPVLIIYGIEGKNFGLGEAVSPEVAAALPEVIRRVTAEIQAWLADELPDDVKT